MYIVNPAKGQWPRIWPVNWAMMTAGESSWILQRRKAARGGTVL